MAKSQKQKTSVKKKKPVTQKKKVMAQKKKSGASKRRKNTVPLKSAPDRAKPEITVAAFGEASSVVMEEFAVNMEDFADVSEEKASIVSIVRGLEGQVETAFKLKEVLESELDTTRKNLSEELETRAQLEGRLKLLEGRAALAEQLREDIFFAEEERNNYANVLAQIQPQLKEVTSERDSHIKKITSIEAHARELENEKMTLEAQVMNLKDKVTDTEHLRRELSVMTESTQDVREQLHDLTRRLEISEMSKNSLETKLASAHQTMQSLRDEVEDFRERVTNSDSRAADMRIQIEDQQAGNRDLMETKTRLENELKMLSINYEAAKSELDSFKNAMRDIRSEATRTSGRVRQKYFKSNETSSSKKTGPKNSSLRQSQLLSTNPQMS